MGLYSFTIDSFLKDHTLLSLFQLCYQVYYEDHIFDESVINVITDHRVDLLFKHHLWCHHNPEGAPAEEPYSCISASSSSSSTHSGCLIMYHPVYAYGVLCRTNPPVSCNYITCYQLGPMQESFLLG